MSKVLTGYKWMTRDHRCFWNGVRFKFGENETIDQFGYSLTTDSPMPGRMIVFSITGEKLLPGRNSICCKVTYLEEDIVRRGLSGIIGVKKFCLLDELFVAKGLYAVPGIYLNLPSNYFLNNKYRKKSLVEIALDLYGDVCPKIRKEGIEVKFTPSSI